MTKLYEIISNLEKENLRLIEKQFESFDAVLVGVRMHPRIFHEIMSDEKSNYYITIDFKNRFNKIGGYPIEIATSVDGYEIVDLKGVVR